tara:strand:- start:90 stop:668 length:579 start_codon:yes stop_codon:yes gene_type:complete
MGQDLGSLNKDQLAQALQLKSLANKPEVLKNLLNLLNAEAKQKPEVLNVQLKALQEMHNLEDAAINFAASAGAADEVDKKQKLASKFINARNLRGILVAKDAMSKAFAMMFGKVFDTNELNETLGGLGDWEEYINQQKKQKHKKEEQDRQKRLQVIKMNRQENQSKHPKNNFPATFQKKHNKNQQEIELVST